MKSKTVFTKKDIIVVLGCVWFALMTLGAVGGSGRENARQLVCAANLKRIGMANDIYANAWNDWYAPVMDGSKTGPNGEPAGGDCGIDAPPYGAWMMNEDLREIMGYETNIEGVSGMLASQFYCPSDVIAKKGIVAAVLSFGTLTSYGYNATEWYGRSSFFNIWGTTNPRIYVGHRVSKIRSPAQKLAFIDSNDWFVHWLGADYTRGWDMLGQASVAAYMNYCCVLGPTLYRHSEGANILFYDGHVECLKKEDVWNLDDYRARPKEPGMWVADYSAIYKRHEYLP